MVDGDVIFDLQISSIMLYWYKHIYLDFQVAQVLIQRISGIHNT